MGAGKAKPPTDGQPTGATSAEGRALQDIAAALRKWGSFYENGTDGALRRSDGAKAAGRAAMTLMLAHLDLLRGCERRYGCRHDLQMVFTYLGDAKRWPDTRDLGDCTGWGDDFTQRKLSDSEWLSFIDEVERWADTLAETPMSETVERDWDNDNNEYIPSADALALARQQNRKLLPKKLSTTLTPNGPMRYMRRYSAKGRPYRCNVHVRDFMTWLRGLPKLKPDGSDISDEAIEEYLADRAATQATIKEEKRKRGR